MTQTQRATPPGELPYYHPQGDEIELFETAFAQGLPVLLKGPTGCGKTRFIQHMAARLAVPLTTVSCHDDLTAADLTGRFLLKGGDTQWVDGPLTRTVRSGGICYLDEVVEARKDVTVVIHPLTDERRQLPLERTGELLQAPPDFMLVASYNPGYQGVLKSLKPSTRQRFISISFDFPPESVEAAIIATESELDGKLSRGLAACGSQLRGLKGIELEEVVSTRLLIYCARLIRQGTPIQSATRATLIEPLTDEPDVQAGLGSIIHACLG
jgi:nitric oxide reductase NorQ protein